MALCCLDIAFVSVHEHAIAMIDHDCEILTLPSFAPRTRLLLFSLVSRELSGLILLYLLSTNLAIFGASGALFKS